MKVRINEAQRVLITCGVDSQVVLLGHVKERSRSHTKKGPGRVHQQGKPASPYPTVIQSEEPYGF